MTAPDPRLWKSLTPGQKCLREKDELNETSKPADTAGGSGAVFVGVEGPAPGHHDVTELRRADEVADAAHTAIVLSLRLVELHANPLTAGELCRATKPQSAGLRETHREEDPRSEGKSLPCWKHDCRDPLG